MLDGVDLVAGTGKALEQIETGVKDIAAIVEQISKSAEEEATGLQEVNSAVGQLDQVTQQNAAMSEEASAASQSLAEQGERLAQLIGQFRIEASSNDTIARETRKAAPRAFCDARATTPDPTPHAAAFASARRDRRATGGGARGAEAERRDWTEF